MCGFLFEYKLGLHEKEFKDSLKFLSHRGPDYCGYSQFGSIKMGHQRLSILDLNPRSNQPFSDINNRYHIIYNGEIFNFKDLIKEYNLDCRTSSDTEVILSLYIKLGPKFINKLNGMFAICIYDNLTNIAFIARDRYGIKPLFYFENSNGFILSSEIKPLLKFIKTSELDPFSVRQYKKLRGLKPGKTLYKDIKEFLPGHYSDGKKINQKCYWKPSFGNSKTFDINQFSTLFEKSIIDCTVSDVSYDCMLSGGLDSSLIVSLTRPKNCWVIGRKDHNEFHYAQLVSEMYGFNLNKILFNPDDFMNELDVEISKRSYPITVPNEILINVLSKKIRYSSKVLLCGEGADEVFLGYDRIFRHFQKKIINIEDFDKFYCYGSKEDYDVIEDAAGHIFGKDISSLREFFVEFHLLGLLKRVDFNTMRHSIESRVPFLHNDLFDYVSNLDSSILIDNFESKKILKKYASVKNKLPKEVIYRDKVGFPVKFDFKTKKFDMNNILNYDDWFEYNIKSTENL